MADPAQRFFMIFSNGRTGTTYLMSCLNRTANVFSGGEVKWAPEYPPLPGVHWVLDPDAENLSGLLVRLNQRVKARDGFEVFGSKFVLDPYVYLKPDAYDAIGKAASKLDVRLFLYRDYLQQFLSWNVKSLSHKLTEKADNAFDPAMRAQIRSLPEPTVQPVLLHRNGEQPDVQAVQDAADAGTSLLPIDYRSAIDKMLVYFCNDLWCYDALRRAGETTVIPYATLPVDKMLAAVDARFEGEDLQAIVNQPAVLKQASAISALQDPADVMQTISTALLSGMDNVVANGMPADDIWQWQGDNRFKLRLPGLGKAVAPAIVEGDQSVEIVDDETIVWTCVNGVRSLVDSRAILAALPDRSAGNLPSPTG